MSTTDTWSLLIGGLGFILALVTLILTRLERRRKLYIHLEVLSADPSRLFPADPRAVEVAEENDDLPWRNLVVVRFVNQGSSPIELDLDTFEISCNGHAAKLWNLEDPVYGRDSIPHPLHSGMSCQVGFEVGRFEDVFGLDYQEQREDPVELRVRDESGRWHKSSRRHVYLREVSAFQRKY